MTIAPILSESIDHRVYICYTEHRKQMKNTLRRRRGGQIVTAAIQRQKAREQVLDIMGEDVFESTGHTMGHRIIKDIVAQKEAQRALR